MDLAVPYAVGGGGLHTCVWEGALTHLCLVKPASLLRHGQEGGSCCDRRLCVVLPWLCFLLWEWHVRKRDASLSGFERKTI